MTGSHTIRQDNDLCLAELVGDVEEFMRSDWNRRPRHNQTRAADRFASLLTASELDELIAERHLREPYLRVVREGRPLNEKRFLRPHLVRDTILRGVADVGKVATEFSRGATIVLDSIEHYHAPLRQLCERLSAELSAAAEVVAFISPRQIPGLTVHYDNTEVFVLQIYGEKHWSVYEQVRPLPHFGKVLRREELGTPVLETNLQPGDCLYVPWGAPHHTVGGKTTSVHVSIQLRPPTWGDVLSNLLDNVLAADLHEPLGLFPQHDVAALAEEAGERLRLLGAELERKDLRKFMAEQVQNNKSHSRPRAGFLQQAAKVADLSSSSVVKRNSSVPYTLDAAEDGHVRLRVGAQTFQFPARAMRTLEFLLAADGRRLAEFSMELGEAATIKVAGHLVDNGLLLVV